MTDQQTPATSTDEVAAVGAIVTDGAYTLFVADFSDTDTAWICPTRRFSPPKTARPSRSKASSS